MGHESEAEIEAEMMVFGPTSRTSPEAVQELSSTALRLRERGTRCREGTPIILASQPLRLFSSDNNRSDSPGNHMPHLHRAVLFQQSFNTAQEMRYHLLKSNIVAFIRHIMSDFYQYDQLRAHCTAHVFRISCDTNKDAVRNV